MTVLVLLSDGGWVILGMLVLAAVAVVGLVVVFIVARKIG